MSRIRWFGWLGIGMLTSTLAVFALHPTAHGSPDASLLAQRIALGKQLFNDASLSADGTVRCASCHIPEKAYADGRATAVGVYGRVGTRNTPSLLSVEIAKEGAFSGMDDARCSNKRSLIRSPIRWRWGCTIKRK